MSSKDIHKTSYDTLKLLNYIIEHDTICTKYIASILQKNKSKRSDTRHFDTIQTFFKRELDIDVFDREGRGCYRVINKDTLQQALNLGDKKELLSYMQILKEVLPHYYNTLDKKTREKIDKAEKDADLVYIFHNNPMEDFKNNEALKEVEKAVKLRRKVAFEYRGITYKEVRPLNIVFMEGNLYLACITEDEFNGGFKFLRIHLIRDLKISNSEYNETEKVLEVRRFLQDFQTPFAVFRGEYRRVVLKATPKAAEHFMQKKYLPSQEVQQLDDGSALLTFHVTDYMEISPMVKKWLPHLVLQEPKEWKERLADELTHYVSKLTHSVD